MSKKSSKRKTVEPVPIDYTTWRAVDVTTVVWSDQLKCWMLPVLGVWGTCPCPHCGHTLNQREDHLSGDTAALMCPECGGGSWMPPHPLEAAYTSALHQMTDVRQTKGGDEALMAAEGALMAADQEWESFLNGVANGQSVP